MFLREKDRFLAWESNEEEKSGIQIGEEKEKMTNKRREERESVLRRMKKKVSSLDG